MPLVPLTTTDRAYLLNANGDYVVAAQTTPSQTLVTPNASLTSNARHVISHASATVVARSSGRGVYSRGGIAALSTPNPSLIVQPLPTGSATLTTAFLTEFGSYLSYP